MSLWTYHYDTLFDSCEHLTDPLASEVVKKYYDYIRDIINPKLKKRNKWWFLQGHVTYSFLEHYWFPNGIKTWTDVVQQGQTENYH